MTVYSVPILDEGDGGVVAKVRITGDVTWPGCLQLAEVLGRADPPVPIVFSPHGPPPLVVTVPQASKALGFTPAQVRRYIRSGHLETVVIPESHARGRPCREIDGVPTPAPHDPRNYRAIPWESLVAFVTRAREQGFFPVVVESAIPKPKTAKPLRDIVVGELAAVHPRALTTGELRLAVDAWLQAHGDARTVSPGNLNKAVDDAIKAGQVGNVQITTKNKQGKLRRWRWIKPKGEK